MCNIISEQVSNGTLKYWCIIHRSPLSVQNGEISRRCTRAEELLLNQYDKVVPGKEIPNEVFVTRKGVLLQSPFFTPGQWKRFCKMIKEGKFDKLTDEFWGDN